MQLGKSFYDEIKMSLNFTDDAKTVTREDVLGSSAVDNSSKTKMTTDFFVYLHLASRQKRRYNKIKHSRGRARWRNWKRS